LPLYQLVVKTSRFNSGAPTAEISWRLSDGDQVRVRALHCGDAQILPFHVEPLNFGDDFFGRPLLPLDNLVIVEPGCLYRLPPTAEAVSGFSEQGEVITPCPAQLINSPLTIQAPNFLDDELLVAFDLVFFELLDVGVVIDAGGDDRLTPTAEKTFEPPSARFGKPLRQRMVSNLHPIGVAA
jgi:hypothetical protein